MSEEVKNPRDMNTAEGGVIQDCLDQMRDKFKTADKMEQESIFRDVFRLRIGMNSFYDDANIILNGRE